jgi:hypothetical protein
MPSDPEPTGQSKARGLPQHSQHYTRPCQAIVPATGPQESGAVSGSLRTSSISYAAAAALLQRNSVASTHMRWRTTPSLRARATLARFMPRRCATSSAQRFKLEKRIARVSMIWAASKSAVLTMVSPTLLTPPSRSVSPEIGADRTGFSEPRRIIHRRAICQGDQSADAGCAHQPPANLVGTRNL